MVLGAGIVGTSVALALQEAGLGVVLVDRRGPGEETSFGNAGLIEHLPHPAFGFPRSIAKLAKVASGRDIAARIELAALPGLSGWLWRYWKASSPAALRGSDAALRSLSANAVAAHRQWAAAAGYGALHETGVVQVFEGRGGVEARADEQRAAAALGIPSRAIDRLSAEEPALALAAPALHWTESGWIDAPGALVQAYAAYFQKLGGRVFLGDAMTVETDHSGYRLATEDGTVNARRIVVALGPWSDMLVSRWGYAAPVAIKRGYSRAYRLDKAAPVLTRPIVCTDGGYVLSPCTEGVRLMTGVEFAGRHRPGTTNHIARAEAAARSVYPALADAVPGPLWMGRRPCLPDMVPLIGALPGHPNILMANGHNHWGLTMAPATASIIRNLVLGRPSGIDTMPFDPARFAPQAR